MTNSYLIDEFVTTKPGEPYRLFPFGKVTKSGVTRELTPELAQRFKLPHFKPPIKLGSHKDETPAGGHITGLEVRADGLYAILETTPNGQTAFANGAYRYHSPEVIWEDGGIEDADGNFIPGPLIVGDALLHTPHLGEAAALYTYEITKGATMTDMIQVPQSLWDKFVARFEKDTEPPEKPKGVEPEKYAALEKERDDFRAQIEQMQAEQKRKEEFAALVSTLQSEKYGAVFTEQKAAHEAAEVLGALDEKPRAWIMQQFAALIAQIDESKLTGETGTTGAEGNDSPYEAFNALVRGKMEALTIPYHEAYEIVKKENKDAFKAAFGGA